MVSKLEVFAVKIAQLQLIAGICRLCGRSEKSNLMPSPKIKPLDPAKVALLKCRGHAQSEIARRLGLGEATVSRLLSHKGGGRSLWYIKPPEFDWSKVDLAQRDELLPLERNDTDR